MRCVIGGKATPETGGVTNRAYPTAALRFEFGISNFRLVSDFEIRIFPDLSGRIMQNEPNPRYWRPRFYETNPIYAYPSLAHDPNMRNEPNPAPILYGVPLQRRIGAGKRTQFRPSPRPEYAKRTQFQFCHSRGSGNPRTPAPGNHQLPTKNAKRTQSTVSPPAHTPKCAKRTQFAPPPPSADPKIRNKPNLTRPTTQKIETNPIPQGQLPKANRQKTQNKPNPSKTSRKPLWHKHLRDSRYQEPFLGELNDEYPTEKCRMSTW